MTVSIMRGEQGMSDDPGLADNDWRTSSRSSQGADCVQVRVIDTASEH
jgi:Domain of unknown function (DUF397)